MPSPSRSAAPSKPHVNVGTIGEFDHGKTTLAAAVVARRAHRNGVEQFKSYKEIARGGVERDELKTVTLSPAYVEYETPNRYYAHIDCPGLGDRFRAVVRAMTQADGAVLVVAADDGPTPRTVEHLLIARQMGVRHVVVFLSKVDLVDDPHLLDLVEVEVRQLLQRWGYLGDEIPVVRGNALAAMLAGGKDDDACKCVDELAEALDATIPLPEPRAGGPFLMSVEDVFSIKGRGTIAVGRVERGTLRVGDEAEVVGLTRSPGKTVILGIETFNKTLEKAVAGDNVGVLLRGVGRGKIERGQVLAQPGSVTAHGKFEADVYPLTQEEGGHGRPLFSGARAEFCFRTADVAGTIHLPGGVEMGMPGEEVRVRVDLGPDAPLALGAGETFLFRGGGCTIGIGSVVNVLD